VAIREEQRRDDEDRGEEDQESRRVHGVKKKDPPSRENGPFDQCAVCQQLHPAMLCRREPITQKDPP